jgi:hypothetical protein
VTQGRQLPKLNVEGSPFGRSKEDNLVDLNVWAGAYSLQLLEATHDNYHDRVILDRGPWDASCWLHYLAESDRGTGEYSHDSLVASRWG